MQLLVTCFTTRQELKPYFMQLFKRSHTRKNGGKSSVTGKCVRAGYSAHWAASQSRLGALSFTRASVPLDRERETPPYVRAVPPTHPEASLKLDRFLFLLLLRSTLKFCCCRAPRRSR
ncbi:hypothetical protein B5X24_HaOG217070 [Helicoverpa armigera]|uniref:Uncharacterized protein n=1 Tax=Helicoverpa armigera TaxID=29058 RepID=A0A2W1C1N8_HELAM|nr:hypothetical protein B5X24_HaOG217070 [Helicoverpa armigera]